MDLLAVFKRKNPPPGFGGDDRPDFTGNVVVVYCNLNQMGGTFEDPRLVRIGFNEFMVGHFIDLDSSTPQPRSKATFWIAIHDIAQMMVFDDIEAARSSFSAAKPDEE